MNNLYDFEFKDLQGNVFPMQQLEGQSTAGRQHRQPMWFYPHYRGLQELQKKYEARGFSV